MYKILRAKPWVLYGLLLVPTLLSATVNVRNASIHDPLGDLVKMDTVAPRKPHKMDKNHFMEAFGKDDSSRAVITFFFHRRHWAKEYVVIPLAIVGAAALAFGIYDWVSCGAQINFLWLVPVTLITGATITLGIIGTINMLKYSRKRLYKILEQYNSGKPLPHKLMYKNSYIRKNITRIKLNS